MKELIAIILTSSISLIAFGQNWAPTGAMWHYEVVYPFSSQLSYIKYESVGDTTILNKACKIITATEGITEYGYLIGNSNTAFTYEDNGMIYVFDPSNNDFSLVYNFEADSGTTWTTTWDTCNYERMILSIDSIEINGNNIKTLSFGGFTIYERIGGERTLFHGLGMVNCEPPDTIVYEYPFIQRLRCYQDDEIGFYNTGISPSCDYIVGIEKLDQSKNQVIIYPNPTADDFTIRLNNKTGKQYIICLNTILGEEIKKVETQKEEISLSIGNIPPGLYFVEVTDGKNERIIKKLIINAP